MIRSPQVYVAGAMLVAVVAALLAHQARVPTPPGIEAERNARFVVTGVDPNTATLAELTTLPGIGETKAHRIIEYRDSFQASVPDAERAFKRPQDLAAVKGIGPKTVEKLRPWLRFDD